MSKMLKRIFIISASFLMFLGVGVSINHANVHANAPVTLTRYTNGRYNYYYPYTINDLEKRGRINRRAEPLYNGYRYNDKMVILDYHYPEYKSAVVKHNGQKYNLVISSLEHLGKNGRFLNGTGINDNNTNNSYDGHHEVPGMGYINSKDFSTHRMNNHKRGYRNNNRKIFREIHKLQAQINRLKKQLR